MEFDVSVHVAYDVTIDVTKCLRLRKMVER